MTDASRGQPRQARPDEADAIRRVVHDAYAHYVERIGKPPGPMLDDYPRRIRDGQAWVLESHGLIVGLVVLEDDGPDSLLLDSIAVVPSEQGQGIGRQLIAFTENEARRRGRTFVRLYTNAAMTENIQLYGRLGFREEGRVSEAGFDRVYMSKSLP